MCIFPIRFFFFFFNDTATTEIYTLPLHDALPISRFPLMTYLIIGFCQCLAMIPGVSRSGATIVAAMLLGADRRSAAEFSFYLAMPTMAGGVCLQPFKKRGTNQASHPVLLGGRVSGV